MIEINISNKRAELIGAPVIVCGNADYQIHFTFDDEWAADTSKIARFVWTRRGVRQSADTPIVDGIASVPKLINTREVSVGVYALHTHTTTPARIPCECSIRCLTDKGVAHQDAYEAAIEALDTVVKTMEGKSTPLGLSGLTTLREYALYRNTGLTSIDLPDCINVGAYAMQGCTALEWANLPLCEVIGAQALRGCSALKEITLPALTTLAGHAFTECTALERIILPGHTRAVLNGTLSSSHNLAVGGVYVPDDLVDDYKGATNWAGIASLIKPISELEVDA